MQRALGRGLEVIEQFVMLGEFVDELHMIRQSHVGGAADQPLVVPALNRDGDCLSDLVLPMFGSIAGAESVAGIATPGAVPVGGMGCAPSGTIACLRIPARAAGGISASGASRCGAT